MRSIWVRAGLGALAVFSLGMMLYTAVRTTKSRAKAALLELKAEFDSGGAVALGHHGGAVPFILDGRKLGELTRLTLQPGAGGTAPALTASVSLDREHLDAAMLSSCELVPVSPDRFEVSQGFRCATPSDRSLRPLGEVRFEPVGVVRPVLADKAALAQLRQRGTITIDSSHGGVVRANISGNSGELVNIQADSSGAYIFVNDGKGKVVKVRADKSGLVVKVDSSATQ
jgi:hypothetical protein